MRDRLGILTALLLLSLTAVFAKKDQPAVSETSFKSQPGNLFYFGDSDVVLTQDVLPGIIYRSEDAGQNWKRVKDITEAESLTVIPHPYNDQVAVTVGTARTHWITKDQGETWIAFKTDDNPVLNRPPVVYHATDPDRIIFLTAQCEGWECTPQVREGNTAHQSGTDVGRPFTL